MGFKRVKTVLIIYVICIFLGVVALTITKVHWHKGLALLAVTLVIMLGLGMRLSFVDTKRFGRKKTAHEN